ncbi:hypothetical protein SXANM310S_06854 [Streptomyces xanthochromogenes]
MALPPTPRMTTTPAPGAVRVTSALTVTRVAVPFAVTQVAAVPGSVRGRTAFSVPRVITTPATTRATTAPATPGGAV